MRALHAWAGCARSSGGKAFIDRSSNPSCLRLHPFHCLSHGGLESYRRSGTVFGVTDLGPGWMLGWVGYTCNDASVFVFGDNFQLIVQRQQV